MSKWKSVYEGHPLASELSYPRMANACWVKDTNGDVRLAYVESQTDEFYDFETDKYIPNVAYWKRLKKPK